MSAFVKIPLQLLILSTGVLVFVFYLFQAPPMLFNRAYDARVAAGPQAPDYARSSSSSPSAIAARRQAAVRADREAFLASDARVLAIRTARRRYRQGNDGRYAVYRRQLRVSRRSSRRGCRSASSG